MQLKRSELDALIEFHEYVLVHLPPEHLSTANVQKASELVKTLKRRGLPYEGAKIEHFFNPSPDGDGGETRERTAEEIRYAEAYRESQKFRRSIDGHALLHEPEGITPWAVKSPSGKIVGRYLSQEDAIDRISSHNSDVRSFTKVTLTDGRVGYSWCSTKDSWNRKYGIKIAYRRAKDLPKQSDDESKESKDSDAFWHALNPEQAVSSVE